MRIHFFVNFVHEQGTYFRFHNLARGLMAHGHDVTVFACDHDFQLPARTEVRDGVPYEILPQDRGANWFGHNCNPLTALRRAAIRNPPCDVAQLFQPFPGAAAAWWRSRASVKIYDWDDRWYGGLFPNRAQRFRDHWQRRTTGFLEQRLPRWADHVTVISHHLADLATARGARGVTVINSGSWPRETPDRANARTRLGLNADSLYVGFMGRTTDELPWCFSAMEKQLEKRPNVRLAICGAPANVVEAAPSQVRSRIDYLGALSPDDAGQFAASIDLALLPMADNEFNRARLPQKFGDHLAAGVPLLCSGVGECELLMKQMGGVIRAGSVREEWECDFDRAIGLVESGIAPKTSCESFRQALSWEKLSGRLAATYSELFQRRDAMIEPTAREPASAAVRSTPREVNY